MYKAIALTAVLLLLTTSASFADDDITQVQGFLTGSTSYGIVSGGSTGSVASFNASPVANFQQLTDDDGNTKYFQVSNSSLVQAAGTVGLYGDYGFSQAAEASGTQVQSSGDDNNWLSLGLQSQIIGSAFSTDILKNGAFGNTITTQNAIITEGQLISTPYGVNASFAAVGVDSAAGVLVNRSLNITRLGIN